MEMSVVPQLRCRATERTSVVIGGGLTLMVVLMSALLAHTQRRQTEQAQQALRWFKSELRTAQADGGSGVQRTGLR
jgi:hypothetical protein